MLFRFLPFNPSWECTVSGILLLLGGLVLIGCEGRGTPPDVPTGTYTAYIDGMLSDTLSGSVHYRTSEGAITGLELGSQEGPGLSVELEPHPPALRTYEVVGAELFAMDRPDSPPGAMAFLAVDSARFEATAGTFEVTYLNEGQIGATFTFQMEGTWSGASGEPSSVEVIGRLNAPSER